MAHHLTGFVFHGDHALGMAQIDTSRQSRGAGQKRGKHRLITMQDKKRIGQFDSGKRKTGDNCRRSLIAAHRIDGNNGL